VKYVQDIQVINVINDNKKPMNVYTLDVIPSTKAVMLSRNVDTTNLVQVTLNLQTVLDYYY